ncbi:hypothetical protein CJ030_MR0G008987 [Morella rubra]|uniref:Uncharacterized protein n=1 Tax=Morella rubra TaxID=262757 RepID=A0A6A1UHK7_9ROSI|nr:hypothetical protein CJ030_MR0G008987 [Morella rubra]
MSPIPSPTPSAPSPRVNEGMSQGTPACPSSCASTSASKRGRGRTRGVSLEKSLGSGSETIGAYPGGRVWRSVFHCCHSIDEDWNVGPRADSDLVNKWVDVPAEVKEYIMDRVLDHFDLDYTRHEDVRTVVETMMTARRTHRNRMHAYFKKFPSKEAALLKPHPDTTEEQWKELCDLFTSEAFMKRSEQNKKNRSKLTVNHAAGSRSFQRTRACMKNQESGNINPAELYKKNYTNKDGIWTSEGAREIYERMDAFQRQCDLEGKTYTEIEVYSEILGKKSGYVRGLGRAVKPPPSSTLTTQSSDLQHQLAKARDEIEAMRAAREKDLQEFAKKQAEMEATLRDHREEQRVEQERIRLEQEERMKREQERMRVEHEERMQKEQERMRKEQERLRAEISKELEKKMSSVMEKKMSDMSKRLFSQFGGSKR